jgi:hypothetical protein
MEKKYRTLRKLFGVGFNSFKESFINSGQARKLIGWLKEEADTVADTRRVDTSQADSAKLLGEFIGRAQASGAINNIIAVLEGKR